MSSISSSQNFYTYKNPPADHHFIKTTTPCSNPPNRLVKRVDKEWRILSSSLPELILVHVYETRIDLMRSAILGPQGTPYSNGIYFFDIFFPTDYPAVPPKVCFHSHGLRINPNLYEDGHVCLSLLNTWGKQWSKEQSTILQLLVSLQGLVLNSKPYYNEPWLLLPNEYSALEYNDTAFMLSCKLMVITMRNPPEYFGSFVTKHFRERAKEIVAICKAKRLDCKVACELARTFETNGFIREGYWKVVEEVKLGYKANGIIGEGDPKVVKANGFTNKVITCVVVFAFFCFIIFVWEVYTIIY